MLIGLPAKRRRTAIVAGCIAAGAYALMLVVVLTAGYTNLGYGSTGNYIVTGLIFATVVLVMVSLVSWTRRWTPDGQITPWKRTGRFAVMVWAAGAAFALVVFAGAAIPAVAVVVGLLSGSVMALVIPMVWFPIWTVIAAIRGALHPDHVASTWPQPAVAVWEAAPDGDVSGVHPSNVDVPRGSGEAAPQVVGGVAAPAQRSRRWSSRKVVLAGGGVALVAVAAAGLYMGDQYLQVQQYTALVDQIDDVHQTLGDGIAADNTAVEERDTYQAPQQYAQNRMEDAIRANNHDVAVAVGVSRRDLEQISISPWHGSLTQMRTDALAYIDTWLERSERIATSSDADQMNTADTETQIARSTQWELLRQSAKEALPTLFADELSVRANETFYLDKL